MGEGYCSCGMDSNMESLRAKVEEYLTCAICLEQFKDPKVLPCLHSFCHECIIKLKHTENSITCPECRMKVEVGNPPDLSFLPTNFFAKNLLATLSLVSESDAGNIFCENCDSVDPAQTRCEQCNRYLCQFCTDSHGRFRDTKVHDLISIIELKASGPSIIAETVHCPKHKGEEIKLYCNTCRATICRDCTIVDHRQHDFSFVEDVAEAKKSELKKLLDEVKERKVEVSKGLTSVIEREESVTARNESTVADIKKYFENLGKILDVKKNELVEKATILKDSKQKQLHAQREQLEITLASCESSSEFTEQAFKNGNDVQILNMKQYISQSLESLKKKNSQIQPCTNDHFEFITKFSVSDMEDKLFQSLSVIDEKDCSENYTAQFKESEKWLKIGTKSEITIKCNSSGIDNGESLRGVEMMKPFFKGVRVKDVTVSENKDGPYNVSFVALEVGVLKFELYIHGHPALRCSLSRGVKWALRCSLSRGVKWALGNNGKVIESPSFGVGDCILESGIHTWKIKINHTDCEGAKKVDFMVGVVNNDGVDLNSRDEAKWGLSAYTLKRETSKMSLELNMPEKKLTVKPSWGQQLPSVYEVTSPKVLLLPKYIAPRVK